MLQPQQQSDASSCLACRFPCLRLDVVVCLTTLRALTVHDNTNRGGAVAGGTVGCAEENTYITTLQGSCVSLTSGMTAHEEKPGVGW
jgi:hypothetical protein